MARRAIMVDVDGVLLVHPDPKGWSANLERDLGVSPVAIQEAFFKPHWDDIVHGRAPLHERLTLVLQEIAPSVTCERFTEYWFSNDAHINSLLLDELEALNLEGIEVHLATVQEHERASYIWEHLEFRKKFDDMHYSAALGYSKPASSFYRSVEAETGLMPDAIFFIDDKAANVAGARACGWTAALWTGDQTLSTLIADQLWNGSSPPKPDTP